MSTAVCRAGVPDLFRVPDAFAACAPFSAIQDVNKAWKPAFLPGSTSDSSDSFVPSHGSRASINRGVRARPRQTRSVPASLKMPFSHIQSSIASPMRAAAARGRWRSGAFALEILVVIPLFWRAMSGGRTGIRRQRGPPTALIYARRVRYRL